MPQSRDPDEDESERAALAAAAHDLRTPLDALAALSDALGSEPLSQEGRERLRVLASTIHHLRAVATTILDEGRLAAGQPLDPPASFSPAALLADIAALAAARAMRDRKAFDIRIGALPHSAVGQPVMVRRAVENLLDNAFKVATRIELSGSAADENLHIVVSDNGPGFGRKEGAATFARYAPSAGPPGSGLGLWLTKRIADRLGGTLTVESKPASGSRLALVVPLPPAPDPIAPAKQSPGPAASRCVLVVDDNALGRRLARTMLEALGHSVIEADSLTTALEAVRTGRCDVILMDLQMPDGDGYQTLAAIRGQPATGAGPKIIAMSAAGEMARDEALAAGFDDFLAKPIDPTRLATSIAFVIDR